MSKKATQPTVSGLRLPEPQLDRKVEKELRKLMEKGLAANAWRPDFDAFVERRIWNERQHDRVVHLLAERNGGLAGKGVLDLGSGRGGLSVAMMAMGARVTAIDLRARNNRMLELRASRYGWRADIARCRAEALCFADSSFDAVVCKDVTEHVGDPRALVREVARVLRPGGIAYITFINRLGWIDPHYRMPGINFMPRFVAQWIIDIAGRTKDSHRDCQRLSDMHYFTRGAAVDLLRESGLIPEDITEKRIGGGWRGAAHRHLSLGRATLEFFASR